MSFIWKSDGSTNPTPGNGRGWGGGKQTHSIFGWADDEVVKKPLSETRAQAEAALKPGVDKPAAGAPRKTEEEVHVKVDGRKLQDIAGHNIFNVDEETAPSAGMDHQKRVKEMQGNDIFAIASQPREAKDVSNFKARELKGNTGIFEGYDGNAPSARPTTPSLRVSQPAGGRSTITFG